MLPRRAYLVECLIALFILMLLMGCMPPTPEEEVAAATVLVGPRPEQTQTPTPPPTLTIPPTSTSLPPSTPTATFIPTGTFTPFPTITPIITPLPTASPTPRSSPLPISPSPATPLPPVPVFAGLMRHDLQLQLDGETFTLSYLTGVGSDTHLDVVRDMVAANWDSSRVLDSYHPTPQFSPDRQWMAFNVSYFIPEDDLGRGLPPPDIMIINENGNLIGEPIRGYFDEWLPDGEGVVIWREDSSEFYYFDGRPPFYFTCGHGLHYLSSSPDGKTMICLDLSPSQTKLWRMDQDGTNPTLILTSRPQTSRFYSSWSPDSTWLAYVAADRIWVLEPSTGEAKYFDGFGEFGRGRTPVWSPDGRRVATSSLQSLISNEATIKLFDPVSEQVEELIITFPEDALPDEHFHNLSALTWSPDGNWLAFLLSHRPSDPEAPTTEDIWLVDLDRTTLIRLTDDGVRKDELRWWP